MFSCTETGQDVVEKTDVIGNLKVHSNLYEENLKELTVFFGEVLKEPAAREELFSFAKIEGGAGDINYSLKKLFEDGVEPIARKQSAIVAAFTNKGRESKRIDNDNKVNTDELIDFIIENDISVLAPYLAEDFGPNEIDELTVSWWTQEFEDKNLAIDENWKGATKAIKIPMSNSLDIKKSLHQANEAEYFLADDDWAVDNPTIVLGDFKNEVNDLPFAESKIENLDYAARSTSTPVQLCSANKSNQHLIVRMPALRLEDNIRRWPNQNEIYLWVATAGNFQLGTNGLPIISPDVNMPLARLEITRKEARIKRWKLSNTSFIISSWKPEADNMYLVWGCTRTQTDIDVEGTLKASKDGVSGEIKPKIAIRNSVELVSALSFDKCFTIANNVNGTNQGYGFYSGTTNPIYAFGKVRTYFTLESL